MKPSLKSVACALLAAGAMGTTQAAIVITEVDPSGSGNASYGFDWFELTNNGTEAVNITGWRMDDNSNSFGSSVALNGVTSIGAGQSVIFGESNAPGTALTAFVAAWFGGTAPAGFTFGTYTGSGVGLSTSSDALNIFNSTGGLMANVTFGASNSGASFDNAAGLNGVALTTLSQVGVNGAYADLNGRIGSPGAISAVPVPAAIWLLGSGLGMLGFARRRRAAGV